jgi:hypothetical protein
MKWPFKFTPSESKALSLIPSIRQPTVVVFKLQKYLLVINDSVDLLQIKDPFISQVGYTKIKWALFSLDTTLEDLQSLSSTMILQVN